MNNTISTFVLTLFLLAILLFSIQFFYFLLCKHREINSALNFYNNELNNIKENLNNINYINKTNPIITANENIYYNKFFTLLIAIVIISSAFFVYKHVINSNNVTILEENTSSLIENKEIIMKTDTSEQVWFIFTEDCKRIVKSREIVNDYVSLLNSFDFTYNSSLNKITSWESKDISLLKDNDIICLLVSHIWDNNSSWMLWDNLLQIITSKF